MSARIPGCGGGTYVSHWSRSTGVEGVVKFALKCGTHVPVGWDACPASVSPEAPLPFMSQAYRLGANITPYDAVYVALTGDLGCFPY